MGITLLDTNLMHPAEQITIIMQRIYDRVMTTTSGGNISVIDDAGNIWITPTGVDKGLLKESDIVCIKKDGTVEGVNQPSSEFPFHQAIYEVRPDIRAIVHAHPPALVAFSIVHQVPDMSVFPQSWKLCGEIGYAPYALPGTAALGKEVAEAFSKGHDAIIMENHGTVVGGTDLNACYQRFEMLEMTARTIIYSNMIGATPDYLDKDMLANYGIAQGKPVIQEGRALSGEERSRRSEVCRIVARAGKQGLILSGFGTVSVRLKDGLLITPGNKPRTDLQPHDLVRVTNGKQEPGKVPCASILLHQCIYDRHPEINAIILTQPAYLMAYAISDAPFNVRSIPETWIYLQDLRKLPFGLQEEGAPEAIAEAFSPDQPVMLIRNEAVLVAGTKLLQTFDYLEVSEFSAKSLVLSTSIGDMVPISKERVDELGKVMSKWKNYEWKM
ncbi:class II aldolase/adducin family protein [Flavihumibacter petaseus]|uniref:Putative aldolase n=1 Tax=Flavihumibacter petaseus NBRC 106054 TaxID=1220578 RepID=A0A0E9N167_9BACT|nr:class II aldolase/adducin family protein [Flavihumibacter petaseus]GAO43095.1 putative aldolase [Flavihumibacter petaseus NBRC 106054]